MLVGEKQYPAAALKGPVEHRPGVGRRADDSAALAAKGLQGGRRVDVGDGHYVVGVDHFAHLVPAILHLFAIGHVGQGAAGGHVGEHYGDALAAAFGQAFRPVGEDVGRFGHEVDAAEGDGPALPVGRGQLGQLVAIAAKVGQGDHFVLLIVVAEDQQPRPHFGPHSPDALHQRVVFQRLIGGQIEGRGAQEAMLMLLIFKISMQDYEV